MAFFVNPQLCRCSSLLVREPRGHFISFLITQHIGLGIAQIGDCPDTMMATGCCLGGGVEGEIAMRFDHFSNVVGNMSREPGHQPRLI